MNFITSQTNWYRSRAALLKLKRIEMRFVSGQIGTVLFKTVCLRAGIESGVEAFNNVDARIEHMNKVLHDFEPKFRAII